MNDNSKLIFRAGSAVSLGTAVVAAVLYSISYTNHYDISIRHFNAVPVVTAFAVLFAVAAAVILISALCFRRRGQLIEDDPNQIESFLLWLTAFMFIAFGLISISGNGAALSSSNSVASFGSVCTTLSGPLAIVSALPFVFAVSNSLRGSIIHKLTSFVPVLWGTCLLFKYYFDLTEMPLNDPELILTSVSISAMMIFFLSESRSALGINTPAITLFGSLCAVSLTGCISTARIILSITSGHSIPSLMENIVFFSVSALALTRIISFEAKVPAPVSTHGETDPDIDDVSEESDNSENDPEQ